jgi:uridine kinase
VHLESNLIISFGYPGFSLTSSRKRAEIPIYSFAEHARQKETTSIYSPHVLILEGIFALYDPRVLELLDMKVKSPVISSGCRD